MIENDFVKSKRKIQFGNREKNLIRDEISGRGYAKISQITSHLLKLIRTPAIILSNRCVILDINQQFEKMLNYPKQQLINTRLADLSIECQPNGITSLCMIENELIPKIFQRGRNLEDSTQLYRWTFISGNHRDLNLAFNLTWILFENQYYGIATFSEDLDNNQLENIQQVKNKEYLLEKCKNSTLSQLTGGIAHDLNNTLTTISGSISLIKFEEKSHLTADQEILLNDAEVGIEQATYLTSQLLNFSKNGEITKNPVSMGKIFENVAKFSLSGTNICPIFQIDGKLHPININIAQMSRVFQNIAINAIQAKPRDKKIYFTAKNSSLSRSNKWNLWPGEYVSFSIRDNGVGIPKENLSEIFNLYFSTKKNGNGIGLALCKQIVERYNGIIRVESELNKGSCFHIIFPTILMKS